MARSRTLCKDTSHVRIPALPESNVDRSSPDIGVAASERAARLPTVNREEALNQVAAVLGDSDTARQLGKIVHAAGHAVEILSLLGYPALRHLRTQGFSLHKIATDLRLNVADVAAFVAAQPGYEVDAMEDDEAFADALAFKLYQEMEDASTDHSLNRNQLELFKVRKDLLVELAKRSSNRWAQKPQEQTSHMPSLNINLGVTAPVSGHMNAEQPRATKAPAQDTESALEGEYSDSLEELSDSIPRIAAVDFE